MYMDLMLVNLHMGIKVGQEL